MAEGSERCSNAGDPTSDDDVDEVDGIFMDDKDLSRVDKRGTYRPRDKEQTDNLTEPNVGRTEELTTECAEEAVFRLIRSSPDVRWRRGLLNILTKGRCESSLKKSLAFLHENVRSSIQTISDGDCPSMSFYTEADFSSNSVEPSDWLAIMDGLGFKTRLLETQHDGCCADMVVTERVNITSLEGFCLLLQEAIKMSWTHLLMISSIRPELGSILCHSIGELCEGSGIDRNARETLEDLYSSKPSVIEALGFQQDDGKPLQWQLPVDKILFRRLWTVLCGLFYTVNTQER